MLAQLLGIMSANSASGGGGGPTPSVSALSVASVSGGACKVPAGSGVQTNGTYRLSWSVANSDITNYTTTIYGNGLQIDSVSNNVITYDVTAPGVLNNASNPTTVNVDYQVRATRNSDGNDVSISNTANYTASYGDCGPL